MESIDHTEYRLNAEKNRKAARIIRRVSISFYAVAAVFAVLGAAVAMAGAWTSALIIATSVIIIALNAYQMRDIARTREGVAARWDRLAQGIWR